MSDNEIEEYYDKLNFASATVILKAMLKDKIVVSLKTIKNYLEKNETQEELTKQVKIKHDGHITASYPDEFWQIDIFDLSKYESQNKKYRYIFACVDVFTRKAYCKAMKSKDDLNVIDAFSAIALDSDTKPTVIISDSDTSFLSQKFQKLIKESDIVYDTVPVGDHASLGIIDRFALTLKRTLIKYFLRYKTTNWVDVLGKIITNYNNKPHKGIEDLSPNEAGEEKYRAQIFKLNAFKSQSNTITSDLSNGDKVRININTILKKGSEPKWSGEVFTVENARGKTIMLTNGMKKARSQLLKVGQDAKSTTEKNVIEKANIKRRIKLRLNKEGVNELNLVVGRRR